MVLRGKRGLRLHQLLPALDSYISKYGVPGIIIVAVGTNDLGARDIKGNEHLLVQSLNYIKETYPVFLVWSDILQCRKYKHYANHSVGATARIRLNISGRAAAHSFIGHPNIRHRLPLYYDNVHLNDKGCEIFLDNILRFLQMFISQC